MNYWLVRANWGGDNKMDNFIRGNYWENGYDDGRYRNTVNNINKDDILLLAEKANILYFGVCKENKKNGKIVEVKEWIKFNKSIHFPAKGAYIRTIVRVKNTSLLSMAKEKISLLKEKNELSLKALSIENFTLFGNFEFNFSSGINIFIGENGTGKTHILKAIYAIIQANNSLSKKPSITETNLAEAIFEELNEVFRTKEVKDLRSFDTDKVNIEIDLLDYNIDFAITENSQSRVNITSFSKNISKKDILFIPAKEFLSNFKGFRTLWEEYSISFDKTYYDLTKTLDRPLLKNTSSIEEINNNLEDILQGKIIQENGEFYLKRKKDGKLMIVSMLAEGLRKIGTISYLLRNGSLSKDSILIWDEPESNLNPKHIRAIAKLFIYLEKLGIQIFIATHSLFLIKEIEILRKKEHNIKYFSFGFDEEDNLRVSQDEIFEHLEDIVILDEAIEQSDRFIREVD